MSRPAKHQSPLIEFRDVTIRLGDRLLFEHTHWAMGAGEQWAIAGPNGSGKSTLVKAICGQLPVVEGEIVYRLTRGGTTYADESPERLIACVSIESHRELVARAIEYHQARWSPVEDSPGPTARDVIEESAEDSPSTRCSVIARRMGIEYLLDREIRRLSNGEVRKVLIARALAQRPRLLVLDNPFAGLDTASRIKLKRILSELMRDGMRIIVVTQRPDEIPPLTTHLLYVEGNHVAAMGQKRTLLGSGIGARLEHIERRLVRRGRTPLGVQRRKRSTAPPVLVRIHNAHVVYGPARILKGVDWIVRGGERWVLLGPNGSGKSTLLSLILGDNPQAYANDIEVFGIRREPGHTLWEVKHRIGWLSPELQYHYPAEMDSLQVVCSGFFDSVGLYQSCSERQLRSARRWMRGLGILDLANRSFGSLSDGQQRMLLLARAMVKDPPLLILDEPCQGLDGVHRHTVIEAVDHIARQTGCSLIYVTHHPEERPRCITHTLRLRKGRVVG